MGMENELVRRTGTNRDMVGMGVRVFDEYEGYVG